ncbi:GIY-YIG nuclease family protein [Candidatus Roizmanbacteria bacterium]|nr:GIY-YIG nuclease family protein [Candidatus Roizmanbacteria bacterium]
MFFTYILQSEKDKKLYIGFTDNVEKRLEEHNEGINISTKSRAPFKLLYYEALPTKEEALRRENFYKSGRGHEVIYKILFKSLLR